ncbi:MAG: tetratricopeptide repeat protein [Longimicrobiales bacterium]
MGQPTSPFAPPALLRLGQGLLAEGDPDRAAAYLERLVIDYPRSAERALAYLWLARARRAARQPDAACRAADDGLALAILEPALAELLRAEGAACRA